MIWSRGCRLPEAFNAARAWVFLKQAGSEWSRSSVALLGSTVSARIWKIYGKYRECESFLVWMCLWNCFCVLIHFKSSPILESVYHLDMQYRNLLNRSYIIVEWHANADFICTYSLMFIARLRGNHCHSRRYRKNMMRNLTTQLIRLGRIKTTRARAEAFGFVGFCAHDDDACIHK